MTAPMGPSAARRRLYQMPETEVVEGEYLPPEKTDPESDALAAASAKKEKAMQAVIQHASYSSIAGLVPIPILDNVVVGSVHLQMVKDIAACYDVAYSSRRTALVISVLLWGMGIPSLARWTGSKLLSGIPLVGGLAGWAGSAAMTGAVTYAVGRVLVYHFATGGNLFNFDAEKARSFFVESYKEALTHPTWKTA